jgi:hypothetical protein
MIPANLNPSRFPLSAPEIAMAKGFKELERSPLSHAYRSFTGLTI